MSRSRAPARLEAFVESMGAATAVPHGSSGLKGVLVATGVHDVYLQPGRAGMRLGRVRDRGPGRGRGRRVSPRWTARALDYANDEIENARGLLATNGLLHAAVVDALRREQASRPA